jgi:hypothetical protein
MAFTGFATAAPPIGDKSPRHKMPSAKHINDAKGQL